MARMLMRAFFLSAAVLAVVAPAASAGVIDRFVPVYDAADGVSVAHKGHNVAFRFGPKAAKLYRGLAGKKATVGCGHPVRDDGTTSSSSGGTINTGDGTSRQSPTLESRAGMTWIDVRLPRKRGTATFGLSVPADLCYIAIADPRDDNCPPPTPGDDRCVKVVVAPTEQGQRDLDERLRALELDSFFDQPLAELQQDSDVGDGVVALDSPDASPPPGKVGIFKSEQSSAAVALLRDGTRRYMRQDGDVFSTNVPTLGGGSRLRSLF